MVQTTPQSLAPRPRGDEPHIVPRMPRVNSTCTLSLDWRLVFPEICEADIGERVFCRTFSLNSRGACERGARLVRCDGIEAPGLRIPMKAATDSDGKAATHSDPKRPLFQRSDLAGVIFAVG